MQNLGSNSIYNKVKAHLKINISHQYQELKAIINI
jgi:hypothetical protein